MAHTRYAVLSSLSSGSVLAFNGWAPDKTNPAVNKPSLSTRLYTGERTAASVLAFARKCIAGLPATAEAVELAEGVFEIRVPDAAPAEKASSKK